MGHPPWTRWAEQALLGLAGLPGPLRFDDSLAGDAVSVTTGGFGLLAVGAAVVLLLRPGSRLPGRTDGDDQHLRALLNLQRPADSLGYFALRRDKSLIWSPAGTAVIAYRVIGGVSLAAGDPIGDSRDWAQAIAVWITDCARHGWTPAVLGCSGSGRTVYRKAGFDVVELGDEAIVDVASFTLTGRPMRSVRQAVARIDRAGYRTRISRSRDLSALEMADIVRAASALRAAPSSVVSPWRCRGSAIPATATA